MHDGMFLESGLIDVRLYEIVPEPEPPPGETPRQFLLRMTDRDFPDLTYQGRDFTWQELHDIHALPLIQRILQIAYIPRLWLRKREREGDAE